MELSCKIWVADCARVIRPGLSADVQLGSIINGDILAVQGNATGHSNLALTDTVGQDYTLQQLEDY